MNEFDILKELERLDDDIEPGFLSELKQQTPDELHSRIMDSIRMEAMKNGNMLGNAVKAEVDVEAEAENVAKTIELKQRFRFNYRKYATVASAAVILAVVYITGANDLLQRKLTPEVLSPEHKIVTKSTPANSNETKANQNPKVFGKTTTGTIATEFNQPIETGDYASTKAAGLQEKNNNQSLTDGSPKATPNPSINGNATKTPRSGVIAQKPTEKPQAEMTIVPSKKDNKKPTVAVNDPSLTTTNGKTDTVDPTGQGNDTTTVTGSDTDENDPNIGDNTTPNKSANDLYIASLENIVNYEFTLSDGQTEINQFIDANGSLLSKGIYKLSMDNYVQLNQMLTKSNIIAVKVNEPETGAQSIVIKIILK